MLWGGFAGDLPFFGIYGKLGETKGSFALLAAMQRLKQAGIEVGLVALAHGWPAIESRFRSRVEELGLADRILQIPFLPHWRVPEFLRSCLAVCCLEQDFPIVFHTPVIALEVLMCGACLVGSTEVIRKLPDHVRLPDRYGCVAIDDVHDIEALSTRLTAIARDPEPIAWVAARGRAFARTTQADASDPQGLERLLKSASRRRLPPRRGHTVAAADAEDPRFPVTQLAARVLHAKDEIQDAPELSARSSAPIDLLQARAVLAAVESDAEAGDPSLRPVASAIRLEIAIAQAEDTARPDDQTDERDPLFRLRTTRWAVGDGDLAGLTAIRDPHLRMITFDVSAMRRGNEADVSAAPTPQPRHVVAFAQANGERREPLFISDQTARILELSDGTRTVREIAKANRIGQPGRQQARAPADRGAVRVGPAVAARTAERPPRG